MKREIKSLCPSVSVGFSGVLKENLLTLRRHSKPHSCINSATQSLAHPPRTYTYSLDGNIFADHGFQCVTRYLLAQDKPVKCKVPLP